MRWYSEPVTPVTEILPPLALATRCTSCCKVDSRPSSQKAPPSSSTSTISEMNTRRGQRRGFLADSGALSWGSWLSWSDIRK